MRTCVVTTHSIAGFEHLLRDQESVRTVSGLDEIAGIISELLSQVPLRHAMEEKGRAVVEKHFTREAVRNGVRQSVQTLLDGGNNG